MNLKQQFYLIDEHQFKINALKPVHPELWAIIQKKLRIEWIIATHKINLW
jgi:hypothetical protein